MNLLIKNIRQLVTVNSNGMPFKSGKEMRDLGIIENATVLIENGLFKWIGQNAEFTQTVKENIDIIDASDLVGLPGFVDSHTHLIFAGTREDEFAMRIEGKTYQEITQAGGGILNTVLATRAATKKELKKLARRHLDAMLTEGTTTVEIKSGYGLNEKDEIKMLEAIDDLTEECLMDIVPTFLGAHAYRRSSKTMPMAMLTSFAHVCFHTLHNANLQNSAMLFANKDIFLSNNAGEFLKQQNYLV